MFEKLLKKIAEELNKSNIPYMVIGGQAVLKYREPRFTNDIDITLGVDIDKLNEILAIASKLGLSILTDNPQQFVSDTMVLPTIDQVWGTRVDILFSFTDYEREAIKRANIFSLDDVKVYFSSLEDIIIQKIIAGRERDLEDVRNIILKNPDYDHDFIVNTLSGFQQELNFDSLDRFMKLLKTIK